MAYVPGEQAIPLHAEAPASEMWDLKMGTNSDGVFQMHYVETKPGRSKQFLIPPTGLTLRVGYSIIKLNKKKWARYCWSNAGYYYNLRTEC